MNEHNLLPDVQSAYRTGFCTERANSKVYSDMGDAVLIEKVVLLSNLDHKAAFDTLDHDIFLLRLEKTSLFSGLLLEWIRSYLSNRMQNVYLYGNTSVARLV